MNVKAEKTGCCGFLRKLENIIKGSHLYSYALNLSFITMAEENKNIIIYNTADGKQYQVAFMLY
jgi:hypothetical protein